MRGSERDGKEDRRGEPGVKETMKACGSRTQPKYLSYVGVGSRTPAPGRERVRVEEGGEVLGGVTGTELGCESREATNSAGRAGQCPL